MKTSYAVAISFIHLTSIYQCQCLAEESKSGQPKNMDLAGTKVGDQDKTVMDEEIEGQMTLLHRAALGGCAGVLESLIRSVPLSQLNAGDLHDGATPLLWAAMVGETPVMDSFVEYGADVLAVDRRRNTALHLAAANGHADACWWLMEQGVDPDATNQDDDAALHLAVKGGHFNTTLKLLNFGARAELTNGDGKTPQDIAEEQQHVKIKKLLQSRVTSVTDKH